MALQVRLLIAGLMLAATGPLAGCQSGSDAAACRTAPVQQPPTGPVALPAPGKYSYDQLEALTLRIAADGDALSAAGIQMSFWAPDLDADEVVVTLKTPDACGNKDIIVPRVIAAKDQITFDARYGKDRVLVSPFTQPDAVPG